MTKSRDKCSIFIRLYYIVFELVAKKRFARKDVNLNEIHTLVLTVLTTGLLMWSYALVAFFYIDHPTPAIVGFSASLIHLFSPLLYRVSKNTLMICSVMLGSGVIHQATFSYYTGGFESFILIWFGVIPMLAGIIAGRKGLMIWCGIVSFIAGSFFYLLLNDHQFPMLIDTKGLLLARALIIFGYIFLSTVLIFSFLTLRDYHDKKLMAEKDKVQNLFRILFHDITNPLVIMDNYIRKFRRVYHDECQNQEIEENENLSKYLYKIENSVIILKEISHSVRRMHAAEHGKLKLDIKPTSLNDSIRYVTHLLSENLKVKQLKINYDFNKYRKLYVSVDPTIFKNQVLANLLTNAIKFSEIGENINIHVDYLDKNYVEICVQDHGIGIPQAMIENLFEGDKDTSRTGTSGETGTGFGMLIVKTFMEKFNGEINVQSVEKSHLSQNHGTTIKLKLRYRA